MCLTYGMPRTAQLGSKRCGQHKECIRGAVAQCRDAIFIDFRPRPMTVVPIFSTATKTAAVLLSDGCGAVRNTMETQSSSKNRSGLAFICSIPRFNARDWVHSLWLIVRHTDQRSIAEGGGSASHSPPRPGTGGPHPCEHAQLHLQFEPNPCAANTSGAPPPSAVESPSASVGTQFGLQSLGITTDNGHMTVPHDGSGAAQDFNPWAALPTMAI